MVNNYPEYAAGVNYKKTDSNGVRHFYSAQVVADPSDDTIESKLLKDGVVISEGGGGSSDFSTAKVIFTVEESITEHFPIDIVSLYGNNMFNTLDSADIDPQGIDAVLYKGKAAVYVLQNQGVKIKEVSGAATRLDNWHANITGDCTITFTIATT